MILKDEGLFRRQAEIDLNAEKRKMQRTLEGALAQVQTVLLPFRYPSLSSILLSSLHPSFYSSIHLILHPPFLSPSPLSLPLSHPPSSLPLTLPPTISPSLSLTFHPLHVIQLRNSQEGVVDRTLIANLLTSYFARRR